MRAAFRTSNPALSTKSFGGFTGIRIESQNAMTIRGTADRTAILLAVCVFAAIWPWRLFFQSGDPSLVLPWLGIGTLGGFVTALVTIFKKSWAPATAPIYAACEGLALGSLSAMYEVRYPGIVLQAMALTFGTLAVLLVVYRTGAIRATDGFKRGVIGATGAICLVYLGTFLLRAFGVNVAFMHSAGWLGIGVSLLVVGVAALNLVLDFDFIENGAKQGAPKYMEWYGAFGLLVTLVWLYLELLRLLAKLNSRR
jgi:uncharacterized YccA/Bax inhibitor family protein